MSSLFNRHCDRDLVCYLDGELSASRSAQVERHLESCGRCRAELEELKLALAECAHYRHAADGQSPAAPQAWRDLSHDFSRIDESLASDSLLVRLTRPLVHSGAPRWSFVAGLATLIVLTAVYQLRQAPSVQAASILRKAVQASVAKPVPAHRIRVRTSHQQEFARMALLPASMAQQAELRDVAALFLAAHYDWSNPLSARSFQQWRDLQVQKTDEVTAVASSDQTQIKTVAPEGELASVSIILKGEDYRPLEEMFEFRDREWIELSEISEGDIPGSSLSLHVAPPVRAAETPSRPAAFTPGPSASISDEIQVLSKLSTIGADLGDPLEVALTGGRVKVTGEAITPRRQQQIRDQLAGMPEVDVEFRASQPVNVPLASAAVADPGVAPAASPNLSRLQRHLGGHAEFDKFSAQLLDLEDGAMQRVYALRVLAQKFSPQDEAQMGATDLATLQEIARKHTTVLAKSLSDMERILLPTLSALGGTAANYHPAAPHATSQLATEDLFVHARRVDVLVSQMLGMNAANPGTAALPSELMVAMKELQADLDECQKFLPAR